MRAIDQLDGGAARQERAAALAGGGVTVAWEHGLSAAEWSELAQRAAPALRFLAHGWWQAWAAACLPQGNWRGPLRQAVARDGAGVVQAVLPCARQVMLGIPVLSLAGSYKPFRSFLLATDAPPATAARLVAFCHRHAGARAFRMGPVETAQPEISALKEAFTQAGWRFCRVNRATDYLMDLPADAETWRASLARGKFKRIRAKKKKLSEQGEVRSERCSGLDAAGWQRAIAAAAQVERASWLGSAGGDLFYADDQMAAFWRGYLADAEASRAKCLWLLYLGERPISFSMTLDAGDHTYCLAGAYDEEFKDFSPGAVIDAEALGDCFARGIRVANMGQGDTGYKANWGAKRQEPLEDWLALPPTAAGRLLHLAARAKFRASA